MRWWESPIVLALSGAMAVHVLVVVLLDVAVVYNPPDRAEPPPHVELVDLEIPVPPPPPPPKEPPPPSRDPEPAPRPTPAPPQRVASHDPRPAAPPPPADRPPPPPSSTPTPGGHEQVYALPEDTSRDSVGKHGPVTDDRIGGHGAGTGTGSGSGSGPVEAARPVSIATIKTAAKPRSDYAYFDDAKRYPEEAKQLGIEGDIKVQLIVDELGKVKRTRILTKLGHGLDELALQHARQLEFEPARDTDDHPVTSVVVWTFHMTLPK